MSLLNEFPAPVNAPKFDFEKPVVLLGSCFSTHIADKLRQAGFSVQNNPLGTIFHPVPLARFIIESLNGASDDRILLREDVYLSYDASSEVYAMREDLIRKNLRNIRTEFLSSLEIASTLIVTFGSAHGYRLKSSGEIVANCHKQTGSLFDKKLSEIDELEAVWQNALQLLKRAYPDLQVIFTVSPVRYLRDGWVENNRSKARLTELVYRLSDKSNSSYFPAYEMVNDCLRDYRYFEKDGAHPNSLAIDEVWEAFRRWHISDDANRVVDEVLAFRSMEQHKLLFPESAASARFTTQLNEKREQLRSLYPNVVL